MTALARYDLLDRIAELEAEVDSLRAELGYRNEQRPILRKAFGLNPKQAAVLAILYAARGRWVLRDTIDAAVIDHRSTRIYGAVDVHVCMLRKALGRESIESSKDRPRPEGAVRLTGEAVARIDAAINGLAHEQPR